MPMVFYSYFITLINRRILCIMQCIVHHYQQVNWLGDDSVVAVSIYPWEYIQMVLFVCMPP